MSIRHFPMAYQGKDKRVGFWSLCAYLKKIISSKHWCCGVLAPPPCQLSNCTWDWDLCLSPPRPLPAQYSTWLPSHLPATLCSRVPSSGRHPGNILFKTISQTPPRTSSLFSPNSIYCHLSCHIFNVFVSHLSLIEYQLPRGRDFCVLLTTASPVSRTVYGT